MVIISCVRSNDNNGGKTSSEAADGNKEAAGTTSTRTGTRFFAFSVKDHSFFSASPYITMHGGKGDAPWEQTQYSGSILSKYYLCVVYYNTLTS